jgi:hypothetical protein
MRRLPVTLVALGLSLAACNAAGYRQDASHRPTTPSSGVPEVSTGPTADPAAHPAGLPRAVVGMGRRWGGDLPPLGFLTGAVLLVALGLGVYTVLVGFRRSPPGR